MRNERFWHKIRSHKHIAFRTSVAKAKIVHKIDRPKDRELNKHEMNVKSRRRKKSEKEEEKSVPRMCCQILQNYIKASTTHTYWWLNVLGFCTFVTADEHTLYSKTDKISTTQTYHR